MRYIVFLVMLTGCTDAYWDASIGSLGSTANIECFSGGRLIHSSQSTGKVESFEGGGFVWRATDGTTIKTFADCFVTYKKGGQ